MFYFICPVCSQTLNRIDNTLKCENNHSFDIAKQGYVNLLQSQKSSKKRHGDDTLMINSRRDFLDKGYYSFLVEAIISFLPEKDNVVIADLGCGECWYTAQISEFYKTRNLNADICGIDISKQALIAGSKRDKSISLAVASTADLPIADNSCDVVVTVFAPYSESEIHRVLKSDGVWIKAFPLEKHLMGLKSQIYSEPYENKVDYITPDGFELADEKEIREQIVISNNEDIMNLFRMTPYYYKTGIDDQQKIADLSELKTEIEFGIRKFCK